jgi:uncharacterized protein DUF6152
MNLSNSIRCGCLTRLWNHAIYPKDQIRPLEDSMSKKLLAALALCASLLLLFSIPVFAHHGGSSLYDMGKSTTVKATITDFVWANPHCEISFDGIDETGKPRHWTIEAHPPNIMVTHGWTRRSLKPGDAVSITFHPGQNGGAWGKMIKVNWPDGKELVQD